MNAVFNRLCTHVYHDVRAKRTRRDSYACAKGRRCASGDGRGAQYFFCTLNLWVKKLLYFIISFKINVDMYLIGKSTFSKTAIIKFE